MAFVTGAPLVDPADFKRLVAGVVRFFCALLTLHMEQFIPGKRLRFINLL
ncbi:hypothetical protein [Aeromonas hydrophila]|nr:hypothetical protein [Aeromonas hydrophila]